jgi:hypothetical protein
VIKGLDFLDYKEVKTALALARVVASGGRDNVALVMAIKEAPAFKGLSE